MTSEAFSSIKNEPVAQAVTSVKSAKEMILEDLASNSLPNILNALNTIFKMISRGEDFWECAERAILLLNHSDENVRHLALILLSTIPTSLSDTPLMATGSLLKNSQYGSDPYERAMSIKFLSSLQQTELYQIILDLLRTASSDVSPYVRKAVAITIVKVFTPERSQDLLPILQKLLRDSSVEAVSGAIYAISVLYPNNDEIIHPIYRQLCKILLRLDEWAQAILMHILQRYCRRNFKNPDSDSDDWMDTDIDPDLQLLLDGAQSLLMSTHPSVTMSAASLIYYCGGSLKRRLVAKPLIRLIYSTPGVQCTALSAIIAIIADDAELFVPHTRHFFIVESDCREARLLKLRALSMLARPLNISTIMEELSMHVHVRDRELSKAAVAAMGRAASLGVPLSYNSLVPLIRLLGSPLDYVSSEAVHSLCVLLSGIDCQNRDTADDFLIGDDSDHGMDKAELQTILERLLKFFGKIDDPNAKAALITLIGDRARTIPLHAHEVLRQLAITFPHQDKLVKLATVTLAAKVHVVRGEPAKDLVQFVLAQGIYDQNIDIRDRVRLLYGLLADPSAAPAIASLRSNAVEFIFATKPGVCWDSDVAPASVIEIGSLGQYRGAADAVRTVSWAEKVPPASVRDEEAEVNDIDIKDDASNDAENEEDDIDDFLGIPENTEEKEEDDDLDLDSYI